MNPILANIPLLIYIFGIFTIHSCYLPPKHDNKLPPGTMLENLEEGQKKFIEHFKNKNYDPKTLMQHLENFEKLFQICSESIKLAKVEKTTKRYDDMKDFLEDTLRIIILGQIHKALDDVKTMDSDISDDKYQEATKCLFDLILNLLLHIMKSDKNKNKDIGNIDIIKNVTSLVDRLKNPDSDNHSDTFNIIEKLFNVFLTEGISLKDILIGSEKTIEKLQRPNASDFIATLGEDFEHYRTNLPRIIRLMYLKSMGASGLGQGIPNNPTGPFNKSLKFKEFGENEKDTLSAYFTLDSDYTDTNINEYNNKYANGYTSVFLKNNTDLLYNLKSILPPQGFANKKKHLNNKTKILDAKGCGIFAIIKMLTIYHNKKLSPSFIDKLLHDYVSRKNKINWKKDIVGNLLDADEKVEDKTKQILADCIESLLSIKGPLKEVGLLPKDLVKNYGKSLGVKMVCSTSDNFDPIFTMMKRCINNNIPVCPLLYWGKDKKKGGMHYRPYVMYKDDVMIYDDSGHDVGKDTKLGLKKLMKFQEDAINRMINPPKSNDNEVDKKEREEGEEEGGEEGEEETNDIKHDSRIDKHGIMVSILGTKALDNVTNSIKDVIRKSMKSDTSSEGEGSDIPFCFIIVDPENRIKKINKNERKNVLIYDVENIF